MQLVVLCASALLLLWRSPPALSSRSARLSSQHHPVKTIATRLPGPLLLAPAVHGDARGFFAETYRMAELSELGVADSFVQDNHSRSRRGVIRGMHFHNGEGVAKLVRCARGEILDVLVDLRRGSPTYGEWEGFALSDENMRVLYCPVGFAHGFCVISDVADVLYKQSAYYHPDVERGISVEDPEIAIRWPTPPEQRVVSDRDRHAPTLRSVAAQLPFRFGG